MSNGSVMNRNTLRYMKDVTSKKVLALFDDGSCINRLFLGVDMSAEEIEKIDFVGCSSSMCKFNLSGKVRIAGSTFFFCEIEINSPTVYVIGSIFGNDSLKTKNMAGWEMTNSKIEFADLRDRILDNIVLRNGSLKGSDLRGATLHGAMIDFCDLRGAVMSLEHFSQTDFSFAKLGFWNGIKYQISKVLGFSWNVFVSPKKVTA